MLAYKTLAFKPTVKLKKNATSNETKEESLDLLVKTYNIDEMYVHPISVCIVNKFYVARPDLLSLAFYGSDAYGDIICKANGISNPFELNEGMVIEIPSLQDLETYFTNRERGHCEMIESNSTINKKYNIHQKLASEVRSPAQQIVGNKNYIVNRDLGLVFY